MPLKIDLGTESFKSRGNGSRCVQLVDPVSRQPVRLRQRHAQTLATFVADAIGEGEEQTDSTECIALHRPQALDQVVFLLSPRIIEAFGLLSFTSEKRSPGVCQFHS